MADAAPSGVAPAEGAPAAAPSARTWRERFAAPSLVLVLVLTSLTFAAGLLLRAPCRAAAYSSLDAQYRYGCYTDIPLLYVFRGFADGRTAYVDPPGDDGRYLEYPVLTGAVMQLAAWATGTEGPLGDRMVRFYDVTAVLLWLFALLMTAAVWGSGPRGPTAALMVAVSPALLLSATINWDLVAVGLTAAAVWAWTARRPWLTGVLVGLGAAAKFYPLFLLGPLLVLCVHAALRGHRRRRSAPAADGAPDAASTAMPVAPPARAARPLLDAVAVVVGSVLAWGAVNLPVWLASPDGWLEFYRFSQTRGIDFGSPWLAASFLGWWVPEASSVNVVAGGIFLVACLGVGVLGVLAPRPSLAQLAFLVVAAFAVTNKVYSPQYVLWLLPLAALARPRWPLFLVWQAAEAAYWAGVWRFLLGYGTGIEGGEIDERTYAWIIWLHIGATLLFAAFVVADVVRGRPGGDHPAAARPAAQPSPTTRSAASVV